jgi:hypothetical protein
VGQARDGTAVASRKTKANVENTAQRMVLSPIDLPARIGAAKRTT